MVAAMVQDSIEGLPGRYWHPLADGRIQCDVCPRYCRLNEGQRGLCFVRARQHDRIVLTTYGRSSGFCIDPIEKKPLDHFLPGTPVLSFGTAGCNLTCKFCQNWDISKARALDRLQDEAVPDTLEYLGHATDVWFEITTLLIPGENDSAAEIEAESRWVMEHLGPDVPLHFTAFHPDWKMTDKPPTPPATLRRARRIAIEAGIRYVYTGNIHDPAGQTPYCNGCGSALIGRDWYELTAWTLTAQGACRACGTPCAGVFEPKPGDWGARRQPVDVQA